MIRLFPVVVFGLGIALVSGAPRAAELDDTIYTFFQVEQLEYRAGNDDILAWDVNAWIGNDDHRLAFKSEGEKPVGKTTEAAELQFLYRRPVSDYFDLNVGVRHDLKPDPDRTYGVLGLQGLAKQFVETDLDLFVSEKGDVSLRIDAERDFRLSQRLIVQPSLETTIAVSEDTEIKSGAGVNSLELGLRLRYEIKREFAPYVGLHWEKKFGATANFADQEGEETDDLFLVAGINFWF
ncbi:MAG: copper resistance protein B [Proteobacteria bacterium]|nr:copper resistance protein B [Pseudomonadota bacterium]MDA1022443.1 copper resistance protein B [Pseudomonadota bacterium]